VEKLSEKEEDEDDMYSLIGNGSPLQENIDS